MDASKTPAIFVALGDKTCTECGAELSSGEFFLPEKPDRLLCMHCADLSELEFLPSGNIALTRRASKHSPVCYLVLKFSRARKRFERQGIVVTSEAIERAQEECAADESVRRERQERNHERLARLDQEFIKSFAAAVRAEFPAMPPGREKRIAQHACQKWSGRVGRSAAAKEFEPDAITLAVVAHIRHNETDYDRVLFRMGDRQEARRAVRGTVDEVLDKWRGITP